ncbi:MAG: AMP-binding protein [Desulfomonilaceae bacterium]|jgi:long-chain acyl-CoA synthetase
MSRLGQNKTFNTVYGRFEETARNHGSRPAIAYLGTVWTYSMIHELIERFAASLYNMGLRKGDTAVLYLANTPQWLISWFGMLRIGVAPVPISPIYTPIDLIYLVNDSGAETIVCLDTNFGYVEEISEQTKLKRIIVTNLVDLLPMWKRLLGRAFNTVPEGRYTLAGSNFSFKKLIQRSSSLPPYENFAVNGEDMVEMLYTGGTTGYPKGVPFSNQNLLSSCLMQRSMSETVIPLGEDILISGAPLFHALGQVLAIGGILTGDTCVLLPRVQLDGMLDHIQMYRATSLFGVPQLYRMILEHKRSERYDISSLKYCFCAGDVLASEIEKKWRQRSGVKISQGYGATETCAGVALTPANEEAPEGSCGKLLPGKKIKLVDPISLEPAPLDAGGELLVASEYMVTSYWNKPDETERCFVNLDGQLWYRTKDMVRIDENNWVYFMDRSVDMIKHKGYRIAASEIEAALQTNPVVLASCVVGIPDKKVGERIKAFVVLKDDVKGITGYDLTKWCRNRLAPYKIPEYIEFRDMLPKSKVGKVLRRELKDEEQRRVET